MPGRKLSLIWQHDPTIYAPAKYRRACGYESFIPTPLKGMPLSLDSGIVGLVSEAEDSIRALNDAAQPGLEPLARLLLRTESIASSKVEGMQVGVRELARAEARRESGGKPPGPTAMEVLGNIDAMQLAVDEAATRARFEVEAIVAIHRELMKQSPNPKIAGQIRSRQNWIGGNDHNPCGADFVPPPPEEVAPLLDDLCEAVNDDLLSPLVQAALVHAQFETIHPFEDGNGRTGRALIHVVLRRRGIAKAYVPPISVVLARGRDRYIDGLTRFRGDGIAEWIESFASAAATAAHLASAYLHAVQSVSARWKRGLSGGPNAPRADAAAWEVIRILPAYPLITAPVAAAATKRSKAAIHQAIGQLVTAGVLAPLSAARRNQTWEAVGLLELLESLEAGLLPTEAAG